MNRDPWLAGTEHYERQWKADRRERIATAALQGLLAYPETQGTVIDFAQMSVRYADALIAELDKEGNL